jgi:hypothetical protein
MTLILRPLSDGRLMRFDDTKTPPEVIDRVIAYENAKLGNADDSTMETVGKGAQTLARGMGEGVAQTADLPVQAGQYLWEVGKNLWEEGHGRPYERKSVRSPITEAYNEVVGAPVPGYESMNDWTAMLGPAVVEAITSAGASIPASIGTALARTGARTLPTIAKHVGGGVVRAAGRTAGTEAAGYAGSYGAGELGKLVGGDIGEEIGQGVGGVLAGGVGPTVKGGIRHYYNLNDRSENTLRAIQRLNTENNAQIPITGGLLSPKTLGAIEDRLARDVGPGKKVLETRREQFGGYDRAKQDVTEKIRGRPSGGPITKDTIGDRLIAMMGDAETTIAQKMSKLQEDLEQQAGSLSPTDAMKIERVLSDLVSKRATSPALNEQAARLRDMIRKKYEVVGLTGPQLPTMPYGATKDIRSELGSQLRDEDLMRKVEAPAYEALTDMMRDTANAGGPLDFDVEQQAYNKLRRQEAQVQKHRGTSTSASTDIAEAAPEAQAYNRVLGGQNKGSIRQLAPYERHTPRQLNEVLADSLELELRGPNAGRPVDPERVDPKAMATDWTDKSDRWKNRVTKNDPTHRRMIDDIATVSAAEASRAGKRAVPSATGSTLGEGYSTNMKPATGGILGGWPGAIAAATIDPIVKRIKAGFLTNEAGLTRLFDKEPLAQSAVRAGVGAATGQKLTAEPVFDLGAKVRVNDENDPNFGKTGVVSEITGKRGSRYTVKLSDGTVLNMGRYTIDPVD